MAQAAVLAATMEQVDGPDRAEFINLLYLAIDEVTSAALGYKKQSNNFR
jgi:hypothetical protein